MTKKTLHKQRLFLFWACRDAVSRRLYKRIIRRLLNQYYNISSENHKKSECRCQHSLILWNKFQSRIIDLDSLSSTLILVG